MVALKLAAVAPEATVADAGTASAALLLESATTTPPAGAAPVSVTVQALDAFGPRLAGVQLNPDTRTAGAITVIVPPVPVTAAELALGMAAIVPVTAIGIVEPPDAAVVPMLTVATVPAVIAVAFMPLATHITDPEPELQVRVLPAAVSAGPALTAIDAMLPGVYPKVHCSAAGALPGTVRVRFNEMALPWLTEPEARLNDVV